MTDLLTDYYVYVYIDPRNFEEFYYGKGTGKRKSSHLKDDNDTEKTRRIIAIRNEGLEPIIKVIAKDLTEREAFLIEKTLIWKLGKTLTNISSGHFAEKFRPHDTFHLELMGFDFKNGIYYINVGEGKHRCWKDCLKYGFLSAGQGRRFSDPLKSLEVGDIVVAYLKKHGFVGVGRVQEKVVRINDYRIEGRPLNSMDLSEPGMFDNCENESSEFLVNIQWIRAVDKADAKWRANHGLFTSQLVKASLQNQSHTLGFIEQEFAVDLKEELNVELDNSLGLAEIF